MRTYKVLRVTGEGTYELVGDVVAGSAEGACRAAGTEHGDGQYVAVPERSWGETPPGKLIQKFVFDNEDPDSPDIEPEPDDDDPEGASFANEPDEDDDKVTPAAKQQTLAD